MKADLYIVPTKTDVARTRHRGCLEEERQGSNTLALARVDQKLPPRGWVG
jgi:hypothetical protein